MVTMEAKRPPLGSLAVAWEGIGRGREARRIARARELVTRNEPHEALRLLGRTLRAAESAGRLSGVIEILVLRALILHAHGEEEAALDVAAWALTFGERLGHFRVFADEGPPMSALLCGFLRAQEESKGFLADSSEVPPGYVRTLLAMLEVRAALFRRECEAPGEDR